MPPHPMGDSMIEFACEGCGTHLRVEAHLAGKRARCPRCKLVTNIPTTSRRPKTDRKIAAASPKRSPSPTPPPGALRRCSRCNRSILPNEITREIDGKSHCSYCLTDLGHVKDGSLKDPTELNIPGMVVLRGKKEREAGRRHIDRQAQKQHNPELPE